MESSVCKMGLCQMGTRAPQEQRESPALHGLLPWSVFVSVSGSPSHHKLQQRLREGWSHILGDKSHLYSFSSGIPHPGTHLPQIPAPPPPGISQSGLWGGWGQGSACTLGQA